MKIRMLSSIARRNEQTGKVTAHNPGEVIEVPDREGKRMVAVGLATMVVEKEPDEANQARRGRKPKTEE